METAADEAQHVVASAPAVVADAAGEGEAAVGEVDRERVEIEDGMDEAWPTSTLRRVLKSQYELFIA